MRHGFTLVETLVALVLVQVGLLAVAATSALALRDVAIAARETRAREVARERIELLRMSACTANVEGAHANRAFTESWRVSGDSVMKSIRDSVDFPLPAGRRGRFVIEEKVLCG